MIMPYPGCLTTEERIDIVTELCKEHGCKDKVRKIHYEQFVERDWHPHPPEDFIDWWAKHPDSTEHAVKPKIAWNCQCYRDQFKSELMQYGI